MPRVPREVEELLQSVARELPEVLGSNLVGIYLCGSLTMRAFDPRSSDIDLLVVLKRRLSERQFTKLGKWFSAAGSENAWVTRLEVYFLIAGGLLQPSSRVACAQYHDGALKRCAADGNPLLWINVLDSGRTLNGPDVSTILPPITPEMVQRGLSQELDYLAERLGGSAWRDKGYYRAYAVLTLCRILYTLHTGKVTSKPKAARWAMRRQPGFAALVASALSHDGTWRISGLPLRQLRLFLKVVRRQVEDPDAAERMPRLRYNSLPRE